MTPGEVLFQVVKILFLIVVYALGAYCVITLLICIFLCVHATGKYIMGLIRSSRRDRDRSPAPPEFRSATVDCEIA